MSKGAAQLPNNILLLQAGLHNNILHPDSTIGAFDVNHNMYSMRLVWQHINEIGWHRDDYIVPTGITVRAFFACKKGR